MSSVIPPAGLDDPAATGAPPADPLIGGPPPAGTPPAETLAAPAFAPPAAIAPVEFAFTPAQAVRDLYDFKTAKDAKLYKSATDALPVKHNGTIETLCPMLDKLLKKNRALSFENVSNAATAYVGKQTRASQDNYLFATCILASLDTEGSQALRNSQYSYMKDGHICAALLIKVLLLDCEVETASTNFFVRAQLGNLEQHMVSVDYNIIEFNKHVSELLRKLRQWGEETHNDVLFIYMHVMRAYLICPDTDFLLVIKLQKIKAESDSTLLKLPTLMIAAQKAYQTLLQEGTYNVPQNQDTRLLALAAKYNPTTKSESHKSKGCNARDRGPKPACVIPICSACLFAKATKRSWRTKASAPSLSKATAPGQIISVDQLESSTPGLVAQAKGKPTKSRFTRATVFVDHYSRYTFIHMQTSTNAIETLAAKHAFEFHAASFGVKIAHYHGDNGRFSENVFKDDCAQQGQKLTFCGVNAHFQNGIAERRIRDLQDRSRTMIVHAKHHWPDAITSNLWPYALRLANERSHCIPIFENRNPVQLFTGQDFQVSPYQHLHPFGCPIYVLRDGPASGKKGSKWGERARCGIYLGLSPVHARSICLMMSLTTGMVSPQFHVRAVETFETVATVVGSTNHMPYKSQWQDVHGFSRKEAKDFDTRAVLRPKCPAPALPTVSALQKSVTHLPAPHTHDINRDYPGPRRVRHVERELYPTSASRAIALGHSTIPVPPPLEPIQTMMTMTPTLCLRLFLAKMSPMTSCLRSSFGLTTHQPPPSLTHASWTSLWLLPPARRRQSHLGLLYALVTPCASRVA